ncbi:MAG: NUDIX hydrolase, partial [Rubrivivax sp.]
IQDVTYLRVAFCGTVGEPIAGRVLDRGIVQALWLPLETIRAQRDRHRSPLVMRCIDDHQGGRRLPLAALSADPSLWAPVRWG